MLKDLQKFTNFYKNAQKFAFRMLYVVYRCGNSTFFWDSFEKQSQFAGLRLGIRNPKPDNSGVFAGCLLPGVVPEILIKREDDYVKQTQSTSYCVLRDAYCENGFEKTKPIHSTSLRTCLRLKGESHGWLIRP